MISVHKVSKNYKNKKILTDISFEVEAGQCVALVGANGAGKTTLLNCLLGDQTDSGQIIIDKYSPTHQQLKYMVGVLIQDNVLSNKLTVQELINFYQALYDNPLSNKEIQQWLRFTSEQYKQLVSHLSGGQRRLLSFILILIGRPKIVLLDEPTVAMDTHTRLHFWEIIKQLKQQGVTIIYTSHYIEEIEHTADRVLVLREGKLIHNSTIYSLRNEQIMKVVTVPLVFEKVVNACAQVSNIKIYSDHISFMTESVGEIYQQLIEAGCTIEEMEISHQTLLNTLFNTKESRYE